MDRQGLLRDVPIVMAGSGLVVGLSLLAAGLPTASSIALTAGTLGVLAFLVWQIVDSLRRGAMGLDIVAALAMAAALGVGETIAAAIVALMYAGGQALEAFADGRARREMTALLARVPRTALRQSGSALETIAIEDVAVGDRLLIRLGDVLPVDGHVVDGTALIDQAPVTGESQPVTKRQGDALMSGTTCLGDAFSMTVGATAAASTYAGIVRLVEEASRSQAPMTRLADRYALVFLALTVGLALIAWLVSGDPVRAVAVLVVATPCPLILAVPVALVAGLSRAAGRGVLIKGGQVLETLASIRALVIDKTGTLTHGTAVLDAIRPVGVANPDEVLRLVASLDQMSQHAVARALVAAARQRSLVLSLPEAVEEVAGEGLTGTVDGLALRIGAIAFVTKGIPAADVDAAVQLAGQGGVSVGVAIDGRLAGVLAMADGLRAEVPAVLAALRGLGIRHIVLATGDRADVATAVAGALGLDRIEADLEPADKIAVVQRAKSVGAVAMVGDGVNDAPALAAADVGIAMGAKGAAASVEAADMVLLADGLDGLVTGVAIAQRTRRIAMQSIVAGMGLSSIAMVVAAAGYLPPVQGAILQELIDVAVILNALRALK